jgi:hypothetical protein
MTVKGNDDGDRDAPADRPERSRGLCPQGPEPAVACHNAPRLPIFRRPPRLPCGR